jgi:hypothetical protein
LGETRDRTSPSGERSATSGTAATLAAVPPASHPPLRRVAKGIHMTLRGATPAHAELRSRIVGLTLLSILVDLVSGGLAWFFEGHHGEVTTFWNALFWTTTQLLTVSSQFPNPLTTGGKILDVFLELYALTVVTTLAGAFASFFHHRARDRQAQAAATS